MCYPPPGDFNQSYKQQKIVELTRIELATSGVQSRRSPS
jgi:hypothetical protein